MARRSTCARRLCRSKHRVLAIRRRRSRAPCHRGEQRWHIEVPDRRRPTHLDRRRHRRRPLALRPGEPRSVGAHADDSPIAMVRGGAGVDGARDDQNSTAPMPTPADNSGIAGSSQGDKDQRVDMRRIVTQMRGANHRFFVAGFCSWRTPNEVYLFWFGLKTRIGRQW